MGRSLSLALLALAAAAAGAPRALGVGNTDTASAAPPAPYICEDDPDFKDEASGLSCFDWSKDFNNNGVPDCHEDDADFFTEYYDSDTAPIREACPKSCGVCTLDESENETYRSMAEYYETAAYPSEETWDHEWIECLERAAPGEKCVKKEERQAKDEQRKKQDAADEAFKTFKKVLTKKQRKTLTEDKTQELCLSIADAYKAKKKAAKKKAAKKKAAKTKAAKKKATKK